MLKYIVGAVLLVLSVFAGYLFSYKYYQRLKFYESFCDFNKRLKTAVSFTSRTILSVIEECGNSEFVVLLSDYKIEGKKSVASLQFLDKEERAYFWNYVETIGTTDRKTQLNLLEEAERVICDKFGKSESDYKKYKPMCLKLGFLFGLIVFILIL